MTSLDASMIPRPSAGLRGAVLRVARAAALLFACGCAMGSDCLGYDPGYALGAGMLGNYAISPNTPLATGGAWATYTITPVTLNGRPVAAAWVRANTSDLSVVSVQESDGSTLSLRSGQEGVAELRLFDAQGQVVERFSIPVETPTEVQLTDLPPTILFAGSRASECPVTMAESDRLWTGGTLSYAFTGTLTKLPPAEQEYWGCQAGLLDRNDDEVSFTGTAGQGDLTITTAEGLAVRKTWQVVTASDVAEILIWADYAKVRRSGLTGEISVTAIALTKDHNSIVGPVCSWTSADPTVHITNRNPLRSMLYADTVGAVLPGSGSYDLSCTIGTAQATAHLVYPPPS